MLSDRLQLLWDHTFPKVPKIVCRVDSKCFQLGSTSPASQTQHSPSLFNGQQLQKIDVKFSVDGILGNAFLSFFENALPIKINLSRRAGDAMNCAADGLGIAASFLY